MTKSPSQSPASAPNTPPPRNRGSFGLGGLFRLVFLGLVGGVGIVGGMALAVFLPNRNPQPPFLEAVLQNLRLVGETKVAPSVFPPVVPNSNNSPEVSPVSPIDSATPSPSPNSTNSPANSPANSPTISSTNPEAAQLQQDLQQVRQQFKEISDRTTSLEQKLGVKEPTGSLETRLEKLSQQLQTPTTSPSPTNNGASPTSPTPTETSPASPSPNSPGSPTTSVSPNASLPITFGGAMQKKITLPTDPLFDSNSNILRPEAIVLLSQVANELRGVAGTTVQVTVHTNLSGEPNNDRRLSFQQAKAVREYLATQLGDRFRFVAIGYGSTRPLVAASDRPENRRIEIIVE